jgi:hypothetical protein
MGSSTVRAIEPSGVFDFNGGGSGKTLLNVAGAPTSTSTPGGKRKRDADDDGATERDGPNLNHQATNKPRGVQFVPGMKVPKMHTLRRNKNNNNGSGIPGSPVKRTGGRGGAFEKGRKILSMTRLNLLASPKKRKIDMGESGGETAEGGEGGGDGKPTWRV